MLEKLESISWEPEAAAPVASISPFLKALKRAWESICLYWTDSSLAGLPHHSGLGTKVTWVSSTESTVKGPAPHSAWGSLFQPSLKTVGSAQSG